MLAKLLSARNLEQTLQRAVIHGDPNVLLPTVPVAELRDLYSRMRANDAPGVAQSLLNALRVSVHETGSVGKVPSTGAAVVVANHPFGLLDGAVLLSILTQVRPDVRLLVNRVLRCVPGMEKHCIFVDPFSTADRALNGVALRQALQWLRSGGLLATFPAGEVAHFRISEAALTDPQWAPTAAWLAKQAGCDLVPVFFQGRNSVPFQIVGLLHPAFRTLRLPRELLNKQHQTVRFAVGSPISKAQIAAIDDGRAITSIARWRTYSVPNRLGAVVSTKVRRHATPVAAAVNRDQFGSELAALRASGGVVEETNEYEVLLMRGAKYSAVMHEIGRARELAFRHVGEGSGKSIDLDQFDEYYDHLLLWHKRECAIAGGYRLARTADVLSSRGIRGLYTSTLFRFKPNFFRQLGPAIELGRSFVALDFQKTYAPLYLLWRGIGSYLAESGGTPVLFGPVSISREYSDKSRQVITTYFQLRNAEDPLAELVQPKSFRRPGHLRSWELEALAHVSDLDALGYEVAQLEPDGKGLPVLLRQYVKLGGRLLAFNIDGQFSSVIDGLVVVDVRHTEPRIAAKYIGKERHELLCRKEASGVCP